MVKTYSEKSVQMLSDQIESDRKNRFLPLSFWKILYFTYVNTFSKMSSQTISDRIESGGKNHFLLFPFWKAIPKKESLLSKPNVLREAS